MTTTKTAVQFIVRCGPERDLRDAHDVRAMVVEHLEHGARLSDIDIIRQEIEVSLVREHVVSPEHILNVHVAPEHEGPWPVELTDLGDHPAGAQPQANEQDRIDAELAEQDIP